MTAPSIPFQSNPLYEPQHQETGKTESIDLQDTKLRRIWAYSALGATLSLSGSLFFPPILLASVPITIYAALPVLHTALDALVDRKAPVSVASSVGLLGALAMGHPATAALISCAYYSLQLWKPAWVDQAWFEAAEGKHTFEIVDDRAFVIRCWQEGVTDDGLPILRYALASHDLTRAAPEEPEQIQDLVWEGYGDVNKLLTVLENRLEHPTP